MNNLVQDDSLSKQYKTKIEEEILRHIDSYRENREGVYCNLVFVPQGIGEIFKRQLFGEKDNFLKMSYYKNGNFCEGSESDYLTKVIAYDVFSPKSLEDIFLENMLIKPEVDSVPLFSQGHISRHCDDYWATQESRKLAFPIFYSEMLNLIDSKNPYVFDWDILFKAYNQKVKELGFMEDWHEIKKSINEI